MDIKTDNTQVIINMQKIIDEQLNTIKALNICIGGVNSTTTVNIRRVDYLENIISQCKEEITRLSELVGSYKVDAERYIWLRHGDNDEIVIKHGPVAPDYHWLPRNDRLDEIIDAAMKGNG